MQVSSIPKNGQLFAKMSEQEELFFDPAEYPWQALRRMWEFMRACASDDGWPDSFRPIVHARERGPKARASDLRLVNQRCIRGGERLNADENVIIVGPVYIGDDVKLRQGVVITGPAFIGHGVTLGQGCRVKDSIIGASSNIKYGTRVAHAVLGKRVRIGPGAVLNDEPLDSNDITYDIRRFMSSERPAEKTDYQESGLHTLGLIAGDEVAIGGGAVFAPGVILCPKVVVGHGCRILKRDIYGEGTYALDVQPTQLR